MTQEERREEIARFINFKNALEKQVKHYNEIIKQETNRYALENAKYPTGTLVSIYDRDRGGYAQAARIVRMRSSINSEDYTASIFYICESITGKYQSDFEVRESEIVLIEEIKNAEKIK